MRRCRIGTVAYTSNVRYVVCDLAESWKAEAPKETVTISSSSPANSSRLYLSTFSPTTIALLAARIQRPPIPVAPGSTRRLQPLAREHRGNARAPPLRGFVPRLRNAWVSSKLSIALEIRRYDLERTISASKLLPLTLEINFVGTRWYA
jgi:hypothetical protein